MGVVAHLRYASRITSMRQRTQNTGFDGRVFLLEDEWNTYLRRMPVRYIRKSHAEKCAICGGEGSKENPLEHSHIIGFRVGVVSFALTPDYLDSCENIVSAHKRICNAKAELSSDEISARLSALALTIPAFVK